MRESAKKKKKSTPKILDNTKTTELPFTEMKEMWKGQDWG